jgi:hypothetical protein
MRLTKEQQDLITRAENNMLDLMYDFEQDVEEHVKLFEEVYEVINRYLSDLYEQYQYIDEITKTELMLESVRYNRLNQQISQQLVTLTSNYIDFLEGSLEENYKETVEQTSESMEKVGRSLPLLDKVELLEEDRIKGISHNGHNGYDFGQGLEERAETHINKVIEIINDGIREKLDSQTLAEQLLKAGGSFLYILRSTGRTETARLINRAILDVYIELGITKVKWLDSTELTEIIYGETGFPNVCIDCQNWANGGENGEGIYLIKDVVNCPLHTNCRCVLVAWLG